MSLVINPTTKQPTTLQANDNGLLVDPAPGPGDSTVIDASVVARSGPGRIYHLTPDLIDMNGRVPDPTIFTPWIDVSAFKKVTVYVRLSGTPSENWNTMVYASPVLNDNTWGTPVQWANGIMWRGFFPSTVKNAVIGSWGIHPTTVGSGMGQYPIRIRIDVTAGPNALAYAWVVLEP